MTSATDLSRLTRLGVKPMSSNSARSSRSGRLLVGGGDDSDSMPGEGWWFVVANEVDEWR